MQYKVIGNFVLLGIDLVVKLSKEQAKTRGNSLKLQKNDIYTILEPIQFKNGEVVTILSENISKAILKNLESLVKASKQDQNKTSKSANNSKKPEISKKYVIDEEPVDDDNDINSLPPASDNIDQ